MCASVVAGGDPPPVLDPAEDVLDLVALAVEIFVVRSLDFSVPFGRDNNLHALLLGLSHDGISVVPLVCKEMFRAYAFDEL